MLPTILLSISLTTSVGAPPQAIEITVERRATVTEQIALARHYASAVMRAPGDKREARLRAIVAWDAVAQGWPAESEAVTLARLSQADLFIELRAGANAATVLETLLPLAQRTGNTLAVYRRLGVAYSLAGERERAEDAFEKAERDAILHSDARSAVMTLTESGRFFESTGRPRQASQRYRRLAKMSHVPQTSRAIAAMSSARVNRRASDQTSAREDLQVAAQLLRDARLAGESIEVLESLERELRRLGE